MRLQQPEMIHSPAYYHHGGSSSNGQQHPLARLDSPTTPASRSTTPASRSDFSGHRSSQYKHKSRESMGSLVRGSTADRSMADPSRRPSLVLENGSPTARKERLREGVSEHSSSRPYQGDNQDALVMLFRLSIPIPIFSLAASIYTLLAFFFTVLVSPFRLSIKSSRSQLCDLLVPALHVHERLIGLSKWGSSHHNHPDPDPDPDTDPDLDSDPGADYSIGGLLAVLLLSPFLALALLLLAWIAAFFWVFALLLGNPDGTEKRDDGRAAVLGVCRWWRTWLGRARRNR